MMTIMNFYIYFYILPIDTRRGICAVLLLAEKLPRQDIGKPGALYDVFGAATIRPGNPPFFALFLQECPEVLSLVVGKLDLWKRKRLVSLVSSSMASTKHPIEV